MEKSKLFKIPILIVVVLLFTLFVYNSNLDYDLDKMFEIRYINDKINKLHDVNQELSLLEQQLNHDLSLIEEMKESLNEIVLLNQNNYALIKDLEVATGRTDMRGSGITVKVADNLSDDEDSYDTFDKIVHDIDIRSIINDLINAGAEAIAVNSKRIVNTTEVICSGPVIRINDEVVAEPFIVKAIGDPELLIQAINSESSYAHNIKEKYGIDISVMKSNDILISRNRVKLNINHAKLIEEGE